MLPGFRKNFSLWVLGVLGICASGLLLRIWIFPSELHLDSPALVAVSPDEIPIYFHERPPYYYSTDEGITGLVAEPVKQALASAQISHRWVPLSPQAQLEVIRTDESPAAAIGWFASEARREFAAFSRPVYRDRPFGILVCAHDARFASVSRLEELLSNAQLVLLLKESYSYGEEIDAMISNCAPTSVVTMADTSAMALMLLAGRADYFLIAPEEADILRTYSGDLFEKTRMIELEGMPEGNQRHLMFSKSVPRKVIEQIDQGLPVL